MIRLYVQLGFFSGAEFEHAKDAPIMVRQSSEIAELSRLAVAEHPGMSIRAVVSHTGQLIWTPQDGLVVDATTFPYFREYYSRAA